MGWDDINRNGRFWWNKIKKNKIKTSTKQNAALVRRRFHWSLHALHRAECIFFLLGFRLGVTCPALIYTCVMTSKAHKRYRWIARRDRHNQYACLSNKENSFASQFSNQKRIVGWKVSNVCEKSDRCAPRVTIIYLVIQIACTTECLLVVCVCVYLLVTLSGAHVFSVRMAELAYVVCMCMCVTCKPCGRIFVQKKEKIEIHTYCRYC